MADIERELQEIQEARYGKDVRQAIHDAIHTCYEDGKAGSIDLVAREQIASKADKSELAAKADKSELAAKADKSELAAKADKSELAAKADKSELENVCGSDAYSNTRNYQVNDTCIHNNKLWKCIVACSGIQPPNATYWQEYTITGAISSLNSTMTSKLKCVQEGLEVFVGTTAINIVQGQITQTSNLQSAILQATGWTQIDSVICNIQASVPVFVNYANGVFYAYSINGTYNNVGVNYVAFGHK